MTISGWSFGYFLGAPIAGFILQAFGGAEAGYEAFQCATSSLALHPRRQQLMYVVGKQQARDLLLRVPVTACLCSHRCREVQREPETLEEGLRVRSGGERRRVAGGGALGPTSLAWRWALHPTAK